MKNVIRDKKIISILAAGLMIMLFLSGCTATQTKSTNTNNVDKINLTYVKSPLNVPSIIQKQEDLFGKEFKSDNIEVAFHEITAGPQQTQALAAGELDFLHALGGTSAIIAAANNVDLKIISIYSRAPKAFMILTNSPDIQSIEDLKGKKVGGPKGTVLHQLLLTALETNNLSQEDVEYLSMDIPGALSAMTNKSIDAALLAGPAALQAMKSGAHIITTGEGLVEGTIVIAARGEFLRNHPDLVKRFMKTHEDSLTFIEENKEKVYEATAKETGLTIEDVKMMYEWYDFDPTIRPSDIEELKVTQEFLKKNDMITTTISIEDLIQKIQ